MLHRIYQKSVFDWVGFSAGKMRRYRLQEDEQMYRLIAESSIDLIRILEVDMTIRYASPSHYPVLGFHPSELQGTRCSEMIVAEERDCVIKAFQTMLRNRDEHYQLTFRAKHKNGTSVLLETHGRPVIDETGKIAGVVVVSRDLTQRMKEEEEIRRHEKLAMAGQLAAGIAHEIRNPLTAMKGFAELLRIPSEKQSFYADVVLSELARVEGIVNEFLLLAKPEAVQYQNHSLCELVQDVIVLLGPQAILQEVQIKLQTTGHPVVYGAESQLKQVFINVLKNAIESMVTGGTATVTIMMDENMAIIRIQDEGPGIKEEWLSRLGEPFYTTKEKGTGLGLMMSYNIVRDHGGMITVPSSGADGTCIEIALPLMRGIQTLDLPNGLLERMQQR